ncbi:MAG: hypothetical protein RIS36_1492 [Pseudomonadota bacterium]
MEAAVQGEAVPCKVTVKNHGSEPAPLPQFSLLLGLGALKKVKAKASDAFEVLARADLDRSQVVPANGEFVTSWEFHLDRNSPLSDKNQTPFLLYGNGDTPENIGQIPLTVTMHPRARAVFDTCERVFSLINKGETWKDGYTLVKYKAPDLRKFSLVEEIVIGVRFVDDSLELGYTFKVKKIDATAHSLNFKKGKAEVTQTWSPQEYLFGGGFIRQEFVEKMLDEAFSVVATGF